MAFWIAFPWGCNNHLGWNRFSIFTTWVGFSTTSKVHSDDLLGLHFRIRLGHFGRWSTNSVLWGAQLGRTAGGLVPNLLPPKHHQKNLRWLFNQYFWGCYIVLLFLYWDSTWGRYIYLVQLYFQAARPEAVLFVKFLFGIADYKIYRIGDLEAWDWAGFEPGK